MKSKLLLFLLLVFSFGNAQINISEGFESGGLPSGWVNNGFGFFNNPGFATSGNFYASANSVIGSDKFITTSSQTSNGNPMYVSIKVRKQLGISGFAALYYLVGASTALNQIAVINFGTPYSPYQTLSGTIPAGTIPSGTSVKFVIRAAGNAGTASEFMFDDFLVITNSTLGPLITGESYTPFTNSATIAYSLNAFNLATTSVVKYGLTSSNLSNQVVGFSATGNSLTPNTVSITGLSPQTQYYYQIEATNSAGTTTSSIGTFTTSMPIADYNFNNTYNNVNGNTPFSNRVGTTSFVTDRNGNPNSALQVIGNYAYGSNVALPLPSGNSVRTISLWYKSYTTGNGSSLFNYGVAQQYQNFGAYFGATGNIVFWGVNYDSSFGGTYPASVWRHLVMVYDGSNVILYLDGSLVNTIARPLVNTSSAGFLQLGNSTGTTIDFDDLKIYNYALSQTDITNLYNFNSTILSTPTFTQIPPQCSGATFALPTTSTNGITGTWAPAINNTATTTYTFTPTAGQGATTTTMTVTIITNPNVTPNFPGFQPICSGDSFTLPTTSPNGVTGTWSPPFNNMATTTYTFVPNPGQCSINATRIVTVNPTTTTTFTQIAPICSGGSLSLPSFSNENIVGTWSPAVNNTATTTYTFTPTAGQCATTATMTVTVLPSISPTFTQINPICSGASFTLPTTSNNGISGTWSPVINNTATTTYTFTPTNGQCPVTMTVAVNQNQQAQFQQIAPICAGTTLAPLPTTSINFITGTWSPAMNNMATTTYTFTPTDGQCATATMTIVVNPSTTPTFNSVAPICSGATLSALPTTSNNGITGTWSPALNNTSTTTYTFTPTAGQCVSTQTLTITVNSNVTPTFAAVNPICSGATLSALPTTSTNGITGTWSPALNNTATTTYTFTPNAGQCAATQTLTITVNSNVTPTFAAVNPICSGATLSALPTTSTNGITGTWSPALNNTATTTYTFTPNAGQCANAQTLTITVNSNVTPTFTAVNPICSGATLSALPTTSTNGITGTWSPALNNNATTTYTFTPTSGQCATTQTLTITVNSNVTPTFAAVNPICSGATLSALPTTSTNGITGTWSPALNNTATTTYTFTPTSGQCATTQTLTITVNSNMTPTFAAVNPICSGATLSALPTTSTNGITGTWSPALNNTATTTYTFTPNAGQCATTQTLTITVNSAATPTGSATQTFVEGETIANIVVNPTTVVWYASESDAISNTNPLATGTLLVNNATYYAINVVGTCRSTALAVTVTVTLGVNNFNSVSFVLYPNPADEIINIETTLELKLVEIYTLHGQKVLTSNQNQIDVAHLPAGVYMIQILDSDNNSATKKVILK